jgi:hypothetical protein
LENFAELDGREDGADRFANGWVGADEIANDLGSQVGNARGLGLLFQSKEAAAQGDGGGEAAAEPDIGGVLGDGVLEIGDGDGEEFAHLFVFIEDLHVPPPGAVEVRAKDDQHGLQGGWGGRVEHGEIFTGAFEG